MPEKRKEIKIEFKIDEIKTLEHYEYDFVEKGLSKKDLKRGQHLMHLGFNINTEIGIFSVLIENDFIVDNIRLFGIKTLHNFKIRYFKKRIHIKNNKFRFPDGAVLNFVSIAHSGTRGILFTTNRTSEYQKQYLPPLDMPDILRQIKKSASAMINKNIG